MPIATWTAEHKPSRGFSCAATEPRHGALVDERSQSRDVDERHTTSPRSKRTRILIIDDEPHLARTLQILLSDEHEVEVETSGVSARERLLREGSFDAILCDLSMQDLSGMALHRELLGSRPEVAARMVFMTGGAFTDEAREFLEAVPNAHVEKPFRVEDLQALLRATLLRAW